MSIIYNIIYSRADRVTSRPTPVPVGLPRVLKNAIIGARGGYSEVEAGGERFASLDFAIHVAR